MSRAIILFLLVSTCGALAQTNLASVQPPMGTPVAAADLQADVEILRRAYEQLHPGLYRYSSRSEMDADFDALARTLDHDQSLANAYVAFSQFAAKVKCGHTYANFFNQSDAVADRLFKGTNRVPFYFEWVGDEMVVTQDFTATHTLPRGTRVLSINGVKTSDVLATLMTVARADGANDAKRVASLGVRGDSTFETFDVFFPLLFPQARTRMALVATKPGSSRRVVLSVEALSYQQRIAPIEKREAARKGGDQVLFDWRYLDNGSAYLRMPTWALYDSKWDWKAWLNARLDEMVLRKSPALIIDLRGNEGGDDVGNVILPRLVSQDLRPTSLRRLVRYIKVPDDLVPYLDTWDKSFRNWGDAAKALPDAWPTAPPVNYFLLTKYNDDVAGDVIRPAGPHYDGKVYVLVDANNSSATFQFAQVVQENGLGLLVGQPTGGSLRGINGGAFFFVRLPHSKIEMDLPLVGTFPAHAMPDSGLTPDIAISVSDDDIAHGNDPYLQALMRIR